MTKGKRQPIREIVVTVNSDAFWNWLADETQIDLHDMRVSSVVEIEGTEDVAFTLMRKQPLFDVAKALAERPPKGARDDA